MQEPVVFSRTASFYAFSGTPANNLQQFIYALAHPHTVRVRYHRTSVQTIREDTPSARYDVHAGSGLLASLGSRINRVLGQLPRRKKHNCSPARNAGGPQFASQTRLRSGLESS